ncbi:pyridoxal 5'-phosphate synthase glutaminase subunit PdxT [Candidatus Woesearchaeota archaeon]|nr:pyridoxal 5'-phosphate synthase glutaminase subunit PdxT [Candidatus Woesearchaeota archaeon]
MKVGILALQGNVREHASIIFKLGAEPIRVTNTKDLDDIDALIIPGGESTAISLLMQKNGFYSEIKKKNKLGMPVYGTCAGAILLAKTILGNSVKSLGLIDISVERNFYGAQIESFETDLEIKELGKFNGIFIRAPRIKKLGKEVEVFASHEKSPVMIRSHNILVTTFHPELTNDSRVHAYFLEMAKEYKEIRDMQRDIEVHN